MRTKLHLPRLIGRRFFFEILIAPRSYAARCLGGINVVSLPMQSHIMTSFQGKFPISHPSDCIAYYACGFACAAPHPGMVKRLATQRQSLSRTHFPPHSHTSRTHFPPRSHTSDNRRALLAFRNVRNSARVSRDNHRHIGMPNIWIFNRNLVPTLKIAR